MKRDLFYSMDLRDVDFKEMNEMISVKRMKTFKSELCSRYKMLSETDCENICELIYQVFKYYEYLNSNNLNQKEKKRKQKENGETTYSGASKRYYERHREILNELRKLNEKKCEK